MITGQPPPDALGARNFGLEELADCIGAVQAHRTICVLKTLLDGGSPMRVTAPDYHDPDRWWL
jgi:hypothetical protein